ncbi:hypothetical protein B0H19DRAFT_1155952 [Mycena capillaripes]|nr:hypothetical protein B0H19DRAFT_1155952 [Mycena capillaripes]
MSLLPHTRFSNQNLLRLRMRKPPPGSCEAERALITEWAPLAGADAKTRGLRMQERTRRQKEAEDSALRLERGGERDARVEAVLAGTHRARRRCNECRFRRGDFVGYTPDNRASQGNRAVPLVRSRQCEFAPVSMVGRYFPGLRPALPLEDAPTLLKYRMDARTEFHQLWQVRCPTCAVWQELGAFRTWGAYPASTPDMHCNRCFAAMHGHVRLGEELRVWLGAMLDIEARQATDRMLFGWRLLEWYVRRGREDWTKALPAAFGEIIDGLPWVGAGNQQRCCVYSGDNLDEYAHGQKMLDWDRCTAEDLRQRIVRLRRLVETKLSEEERRAFLHNDWFRGWLDSYEKNEGMCAILKDMRSITCDEITGEELVDFVLKDDDPYRLL